MSTLGTGSVGLPFLPPWPSLSHCSRLLVGPSLNHVMMQAEFVFSTFCLFSMSFPNAHDLSFNPLPEQRQEDRKFKGSLSNLVRP